jgi:riboflavin kinase/FMN adenylyltransferase
MAARVWRRLEDVPAGFAPSALTIGNFDGVHAGHQVLLRRATEIGRAHGWHASVLTFDPHPAKVVAPDRAPQLITAFDRRVELMEAQGIEQVLILPFTREVSLWGPEYFVEHLLVERLGVKAVVVGDDFHFGHKQAGDDRLLEQLAVKCGFEVVLVPPVAVRGSRVSSSLVREMAGEGRVDRAARLLGRPFELQGRVVTGEGIGSKQTVPTLNLEPDAEVLPLSGVYVTRTRDLDDGRRWESITNVGIRPTFGGSAMTVETFLLEPFGPPTPARIRVEFLRRIRDERKFESAEDLKAQILRDVQRAKRVHVRLRYLAA